MKRIPFITTFGEIDLANPSAEAFAPEHIAQALSKINRYGGRTRQPWPVAAHSLLVFEIAKLNGAHKLRLPWALLHDAHETFIGDLTSPGQDLICLSRYKDDPAPDFISSRIEYAKSSLDHSLALAWGVKIGDVRNEDKIACQVEMAVFFGHKIPEDDLHNKAKQLLIQMLDENLTWMKWATRWLRVAKPDFNPPHQYAA